MVQVVGLSARALILSFVFLLFFSSSPIRVSIPWVVVDSFAKGGHVLLLPFSVLFFLLFFPSV